MATKKPAPTLDFSAARNGTPEVPPAAPPVAEAPKKYTVNKDVNTGIGKIREVVKELHAEGGELTIKLVQARLPEHYPGDWSGKYVENKAREEIEKILGGKPPVTGKKRGRKPGSKNKPAASTPAEPVKPKNAGDKGLCIEWATVKAGGLNTEWVEVADYLERTWPEINWRKPSNRKQFQMYQLSLKYQTPAAAPKPAPVVQAPPLAMLDIAGYVEMTNHMVKELGWDQVVRLIRHLMDGSKYEFTPSGR